MQQEMEIAPKSYFKIPFINIEDYEFDKVIYVIDKDYAHKYNVIPMELNGNILTVCMGNPNITLYNELSILTKKFVTVFKSCPIKTKILIEKLYKN